MKTRLSQICIAITMLLSVSIANAQQFGGQGGGFGSGFAAQQSAFQAVQGDLLQPGLPGRLWVEANFADRGLGYNGSYLSLGGKTRLFQDRLDGRWLLEGQLNQSIEDDGGFFTTVGIERVFSLSSANTDISFGGFYTYDGDDQQSFSDGFNQLGISAAIKSRRVDLLANGYFPINTKSFSSGDLTGQQIFVGNNIALQPGLENALQGFDVTLRTRPKQLAFANGYVDLGGYHYDSEDDLVSSFGGARLRVGIQLINSLNLIAEVNQDERFDTTGVLSASWTFGNNSSGFGSEYAGLARDLEQTTRNDHIVRFSQDLVVAINPLTGQPFNVIQVNNTQDGMGDGTIESPFATLAEAENASVVNDVIFVDVGDGTDTGYQNGIALKDNQRLLSTGGFQTIREADGTLVVLTTGTTGATISNAGGNAVVELADNNSIGGINIDATGATFGVFGDGISDGRFTQTTVTGASLDGVGLRNVAGNWNFNSNNFSDNLQDGVFIDGASGPDAVFTFENNVATGNVFDGIHLANYEAATVILTGNTTSNQGRHGTYLENATNPNGDTEIFVTNHLADGNGGSGLFVENGAGSVFVNGGTFSNNAAAGFTVTNWETNNADDVISIAALADGTQAAFTGNTMGIAINLDGGRSSLTSITGATVDNNARGIVATADGLDTDLRLNVSGTTTLNNNANEAIGHIATNSATITSVIQGTDDARLALTGNSSEGGPTLSYTLDGADPNNRTQINALVRNVDVNSVNGAALAVDGTGESVIRLRAEDSLLLSTGNAVTIDLDNNVNGEVNETFFDNVDIRGNNGVIANSQAGTLFDLSITNSLVRSAGIISDNSAAFQVGNPAAFGPFTDQSGINGIIVNADGGGVPGALISDNLTRVNLIGNTIEDFTQDGIVLATTGDAQMLATLRANQILRNGPGFDDDGATDDGVLDGGGPVVDPTRGFFFDGLDVTANDSSTISLSVINNTFLNNFDRSINLTTNGTGRINSSIIGNRLTGDIGVDPTAVSLDLFAGEIGVTNLGSMCLDLSSNAFRAQPLDIQVGGPTLTLGLDGLTNGFSFADVGGVFTPSAFGLCDALIDAEITTFSSAGGFTSNDH